MRTCRFLSLFRLMLPTAGAHKWVWEAVVHTDRVTVTTGGRQAGESRAGYQVNICSFMMRFGFCLAERLEALMWERQLLHIRGGYSFHAHGGIADMQMYENNTVLLLRFGLFILFTASALIPPRAAGRRGSPCRWTCDVEQDKCGVCMPLSIRVDLLLSLGGLAACLFWPEKKGLLNSYWNSGWGRLLLSATQHVLNMPFHSRSHNSGFSDSMWNQEANVIISACSQLAPPLLVRLLSMQPQKAREEETYL